MKLKRNLFAVAAIAAALTSCSKTEIIDNNPVSKGGVEIQAKSVHQLVDGTITRVPYVGNIAATNKLEARVVTFKPIADNQVLQADGTMPFATTFNPMAYNTNLPLVPELATNPHKFPTGAGSNIYTMYGLYPSTGWSAFATTDKYGDPTSITFSGKEDVMVTESATTTYNNVLAGIYPILTFKHQLTKLSVKVLAVDQTAKNTWKDLSSIKLTRVTKNVDDVAGHVYTKATYNGNGSPATFTEPAADGMPFWIINSSQAYTDTEFTGQISPIEIPNATASNIVPVAYSMVAPFYAKADHVNNPLGDITLTVKAKFNDAGTWGEVTRNINLNFPNELPNTAGYAFNITLSFTDGLDIVATATVEDWIEGGDVGGIIM